MDRQTLVIIADEVLSTTRPGQAPPTLAQNWVRIFRKRHGLSRLLSSSSDRLPDTPALVAADDQWRAEFEHFCRSEAIPPSMQVCAFLSPRLHHSPFIRWHWTKPLTHTSQRSRGPTACQLGHARSALHTALIKGRSPPHPASHEQVMWWCSS